jgi:hypothetical protein
MKFRIFWDVASCLMMEAVRTSETSVNFNVTIRRYIPEDSKLHTHRRENLLSHSSAGVSACFSFIVPRYRPCSGQITTSLPSRCNVLGGTRASTTLT